MGYPLKQSQTAQNLLFLLISSTDHLTGKTGATVTVTLSKNGAAFAAPSGAVTEIANGWYQVAGNATDANTLGPLLLHATATGADPTDDRFDVVAFDPQATSLGLSLAKTTNITGFNDIAASAIVSSGAITTSAGKVSEVALVDTLTTYTGDTPQTGDSYAIVNSGTYGNAKLVRSVTPANALAVNSGNQAGIDWGNVGNPGATVGLTATTVFTTTNLTNAGPDTSGTTTLLGRLTSARSNYLDNLNVGGAVASHADIVAINQSASKHLLLVTVGQYEPGETYTIEMRTFSAVDGSAVNADTTPTLTATGNVSGSLSGNLSAATNPSTGVYRWTYTPGATPTLEQIRFDGSATINLATFTLSCYAQTVDLPTAVFTATDQTHLTAIYNKLPTNNIADETLLLAAIGTPQQAGSAVTLPSIPSNWITSAGIAAGALNGKGDWLLASSYTAAPTAAAIATTVWQDATAGDFTTSNSVGKFIMGQLAGAFVGSTSVYTSAALANVPSGTSPWGGVITTTQAGTLLRAIGAVTVGNISQESSDHTTTTFLDPNDGTTTRVTSTQSATTRTVTLH